MRKIFKKRSPHEVIFRAKQLYWNTRDRFQFTKGTRFNGRCDVDINAPIGPFFIDSARVKSVAVQYNAQWKEGVLEKANKICDHRFDFLGYRDLSFNDGGSINWHFDSVHKKQSPMDWWQNIDYLDENIVGDYKVIWELNRHQHLVVLGKAYVLTRNEKYRQAFLEQLTAWFDANPPKYGINWASSLELAFRVISWIWAYHFFDRLEGFPDRFRATFYDFLLLQAEHIEYNLSMYFSPNTHLTGEALGLFYVGTFFPDLKKAKRWREKGRNILLQAMDEHILPDGGYMERSLWYHRYTLDFYLHFYLLANLNHLALPVQVAEKILKLSEFLMYASSPMRDFPLLGDDDGGRLLPLDNLGGTDLRGLFSTLSLIFSKGDYKYLSEGFQEESIWLLGPEREEAYQAIEAHPPPMASRGFKDTGYFFMRNDWSKRDNYMAFDCGSHGWLNCGHAHADLLSLHLNSGGRPLIVDPGTYTYIGDTRNDFRGANSHSTIKIDGRYPAVAGDPFHWKTTPQHKLLTWSTNDVYDHVAGSMQGDIDWGHTRDVFFIKPDLFFIADRIEGNGMHAVEARFPLYGRDWDVRDKKCTLKDTLTPCSIEYVGLLDLTLALLDSWVSSCYGHRVPSLTLSIKGTVDLPCKIYFFINLSSQSCDAVVSPESEEPSFSIFSKKTNSEIFTY